MRLLWNTSIFALSSLAFVLTGCGDDELGGVFIPDELPDEEVKEIEDKIRNLCYSSFQKICTL